MVSVSNQTISIKSDENLSEFFQNSKDFVIRFLKEKRYDVTDLVVKNTNTLIISIGEDNSNLRSIEQELRESFSDYSQELDDVQWDIIKNEYDVFESNLKNSNRADHVKITLTNDRGKPKIHIAGENSAVNITKQELKLFFDIRAVYEIDFKEVNTIDMKYLHNVKRKEFTDFFSALKVKYEVNKMDNEFLKDSDGRIYLRLSVTKRVQQDVLQHIHKILNTKQPINFTIEDSIGLKKLFDSKQTKDAINSIENQFECVVEFQSDKIPHEKEADISNSIEVIDDFKNVPDVVYKNKLEFLINIYVVNAMPLSFEYADVVMITVDDFLKPNRNISEKCMQKAGKKVAQECEDFLDELTNGFNESDVFMSSSGSLKSFKQIIHANIPTGTLSKESINLICKSIKKAFKEIDSNKNLDSIAIPLFNGNVNETNQNELIAKSIIDAVFDYFKDPRSTHIKHVFFVHYQSDIYEIFANFLKEKFDIIEKERKIVSLVSSPPLNNKESIHFRIISDIKTKAEQAKSALMKHVYESKKNYVVPQMYMENLPESDIIELAKSFNCDKVFSENGELKLVAFADRLDEFQENLQKEFNHKSKHLLREAQAKYLAKDIQWQFRKTIHDEWKQYNIFLNEEIEQAFNAKLVEVKITNEKDDQSIISFEKWEEKDLNGFTQYLVRRINYKEIYVSFPKPQKWDLNKNLDLITIDPASAEYNEVVNKFFGGGIKSMTTFVFDKVIKIQRVQNERLYFQYQAHKKYFQEMGKFDERTLFHGATSDALASIWTTGFNRSYCGKNAVLYGQGVYFAVQSLYSHNYTNLGVNNKMFGAPNLEFDRSHAHMFLCNVLVGNFAKGDNKTESKNLPKLPNGQIVDSTVNNEANPMIFVIYHDAQAYPEYVIHYTGRHRV